MQNAAYVAYKYYVIVPQIATGTKPIIIQSHFKQCGLNIVSLILFSLVKKKELPFYNDQFAKNKSLELAFLTVVAVCYKGEVNVFIIARFTGDSSEMLIHAKTAFINGTNAGMGTKLPHVL